MTALEFVVVWSQATLVALVVSDWVSRRKLTARLENSEREIKEAAENLAALHNNSINTIKALSDKVNAHELSLTSPNVARMQR